jgi:hypothetical protein
MGNNRAYTLLTLCSMASESVSCGSFYGSTISARNKEVLKDADYKQDSVQLECLRMWIWRRIQTNRIIKANEPWFIFHRLQPALEALVLLGENGKFRLHAFSFEERKLASVDATCSRNDLIYRKYLVTDIDTFWKRYKDIPSKKRHFYEVIVSDMPCRLYFDLEFRKEFNSELNGDSLVQSLKISILEALELLYFKDKIFDKRVVELDSTTDEKFSRHLIYPGVMFQNNCVMGKFVKRLCMQWGHLWQVILGIEEDGFIKMGFLIDEQVYDRNRTFRIYGSSKAGKESILLPLGNADSLDHELFLNSLICYIPGLEGCSNSSDLSTQFLGDLDFSTNSETKSVPRITYPSKTYQSCSQRYSSTSSVYPNLDVWVERFVLQNQGYIRRVNMDPVSDEILTYEIMGNRYCDYIKRQHRSNQVKIVLNLSKGMWFRQCMDPDCRTFLAPESRIVYQIPPGLNPLLSQHLPKANEAFASLIDDQALLDIDLL